MLGEQLLTVWLTGWAGGSTHRAFSHSQAVKARRVATWADLATATVRRAVIILGSAIGAFARRAGLIQFLLDELFLGLGRVVERLIAARILAIAHLLTWSRAWRSIRLRGWNR